MSADDKDKPASLVNEEVARARARIHDHAQMLTQHEARLASIEQIMAGHEKLCTRRWEQLQLQRTEDVQRQERMHSDNRADLSKWRDEQRGNITSIFQKLGETREGAKGWVIGILLSVAGVAVIAAIGLAWELLKRGSP